MSAAAVLERAAPTKDGYPYQGRILPRVTTILGIAPGQHLLSWYAKQGCLETAQWLLAAVCSIQALTVWTPKRSRSQKSLSSSSKARQNGSSPPRSVSPA